MPSRRRPSFVFILVLQILGLFTIAMQGKMVWEQLNPPTDEPPKDLAQDWCSAKAYWQGEPIYGSLAAAITKYIYQPKPGEVPEIHHNAHPPASILFMLPFGLIDYRLSLWFWHALSFLLLAWVILAIFREFNWKWEWWLTIPIIGFLCIFDPFRQQVIQGQWHCVLLLFITGAWLAERKGLMYVAGVCAGVAASLKAFPALLALYFLARLKWKALFAMVGTMLLLALVCVLLFGGNCYFDWYHIVQNDLKEFRASWVNISLPGLWTKMFTGSTAERVIPLVDAPMVTTLLTGLSTLLVAGVLAWYCYTCQKNPSTSLRTDAAYALCITSMLLLSPLTWAHSLLLLVFPILWFIRAWLHQIAPIVVTLGTLYGLTFYHSHYWAELAKAKNIKHVAGPLEALGPLNVVCYGLLLFYFVQLLTALRTRNEDPS